MRLQDLTPAEAQCVSALLDEALQLPNAQRRAWQAGLALREPRWHTLVTQLLQTLTTTTASAQAPSATETSPPTPPESAPEAALETAELIARRLARAAATQAEAPAIAEGRRLGPYRALRLLGQGGMGSVWLAERADGLFERHVALKLLHPSLSGAVLRERFARERLILGGLTHPLIARLLDAGIADDGQPYLALEYVDGVSLTDHCDTQRLDVNARIGLAIQVLEAVQYAHQHLVIHRDLKPANILVTRDGQVRLLDFGIAKLMSEGPAPETELTQLGGRLMTPEYASPEQIAGHPVGTASDVYAIGVLLYALLCGQRPYRPLRESRGALEEAILHAEPPRPSQHIPSEEIAHARATTARRLMHTLAGDLDTIVLKALRKDPAQRYATAEALRQDLLRYLRGEPVQARPDGALYRLRKFVARHRLPVATAALTGVVLVSAAAVSIHQAQTARAQEAAAVREARRAQAVQGFLLDIFKANTDQQRDPARARQTSARELLDIGAHRLPDSLKDEPLAQAEILQTLADMYTQLGLSEGAAPLRLQAVQALKRAHGNDDPRVARALLAYAEDISDTPLRANAPAALEEARQMLDRLGDTSSYARGRVHIEAANVQQYLSLPAMRRHAEAAVSHFRAHPAQWSDLLQALQVAARAHYLSGDFAQAQQLHRAALAQAERHAGDGAPAWEITPRVQLAEAQMAALDLDGAEKNLRTALAVARKLHGDHSGVTLQTQAKLGGFLHSTGRPDEGLRLLEDARAAMGRSDTNASSNAASAVRYFRAMAMLAEGRADEAEPPLAEEIADLRAHYPGSLPLARTLLRYAATLGALGRHEEAQAALGEAWGLWQAATAGALNPRENNRFHLERARLKLAQGDAAGAEAALSPLVASPEGAPLRLDDIQALVIRAQARLLRGDASQAQHLAQQALDDLRASPLGHRYPRLEAEAALSLGQALKRQGAASLGTAHERPAG